MSEPEPRRFGFLGVLREMAWAFLGVRDRGSYERTTRSNPLHIILAGILLTALLVIALVSVVKFALGERPAADPSAHAVPGKVMIDQQRGE
ncbi:DUF2970 domain-containing protein [Immundisolibacter cernigliae]|uniref:DUF2970 domain-containing protein n=1 Tax=Immundisolibacter cernigliae TaxID=1810504 RepID=A0A1B1YR38_9GAMM|nr:DUF2970 domain-containing protein [Immundisolibacter cernigliae]ANX03221.1 hypothetical protein PG2T_02790 [Immundisolibacter cernigliae]